MLRIVASLSISAERRIAAQIEADRRKRIGKDVK
jgi:hypothetical protein